MKGRSHPLVPGPEAEAGRAQRSEGPGAGAGPQWGGGSPWRTCLLEGPRGAGPGCPRARGSPGPHALRLKGQNQFGAPEAALALDGSAGGGVTRGRRRPARWEDVGAWLRATLPRGSLSARPEAAPARAGGDRDLEPGSEAARGSGLPRVFKEEADGRRAQPGPSVPPRLPGHWEGHPQGGAGVTLVRGTIGWYGSALCAQSAWHSAPLPPTAPRLPRPEDKH